MGSQVLYPVTDRGDKAAPGSSYPNSSYICVLIPINIYNEKKIDSNNELFFGIRFVDHSNYNNKLLRIKDEAFPVIKKIHKSHPHIPKTMAMSAPYLQL